MAPRPLLPLCSALLGGAALLCSASCPSYSGWHQLGTKCYWMSDYTLPWKYIGNVCSTKYPGAQPASVHDLMQNAFLAENVAGADSLAWLGLHRTSNDSAWVWSDGSVRNFTAAWYPGEPDQVGEACVLLRGSDGLWADRECSEEKHFICQSDAA